MPTAFDSASLLKNIENLYRADETACVTHLFSATVLNDHERAQALARATRWVEEIRNTHHPMSSVTDLLARFGLSSQEGIALMCLAEALLRIPDRATADALIRDKLSGTHWNEALGDSAPWAMNATGWALAITGKIIELDDPDHHYPGNLLGKLVARVGQPVIREAIKAAMGWMADQFVMGETIEAALQRAKPDAQNGIRFSFDMLGEGARTATDAERYFNTYANAIKAIGQHQSEHNHRSAPGISIKLSALYPRYEMAQREYAVKEMVPRLVALCEQAASFNIPVTIDAEEADRLYLALEIFANLLDTAKLGNWEGLGFAVQAYEKRAPAVIDYFAALACTHRRKLGIRLVKGAYWDTEIKRAQERGWDDFSVYTRKQSTDVSYLACARHLLSAEWINPTFGTHNAMTVAHILELTPDPSRIEFQRLHGMGVDLHRLMENEGLNSCIYAPVGNHDVLLGYLVRRLLENGANSSFVHRLYDPAIPVSTLTADPVAELKSLLTLRHPSIHLAPDLFKPERRNSCGLDLTDPFVTTPLLEEIHRHIGTGYKPVPSARPEEINIAFNTAQRGYASWRQTPVNERAVCLDRLSDLLEQHRTQLMAIIISEAGKTIPDALAEVREAIDFCRYYAARARVDFMPVTMPGPTGEDNRLQLYGRGVFACISPWNFPLAIFLGQITAAVVAGNSVIAKPAPQTPQIAAFTTDLIYKAGIPRDVFHLLPGGTEVGSAIVQYPALAGVAFTGSTATARSINRALAAKDGPIVPLIAETGGQNALIIDSSALPEQVVDDVITSSFRSAGQRCSALRVLCLPETTADKILTMLTGAMQELRIGDPAKLATDVGPVIDVEAQKRLNKHIERLQREAKRICTLELNNTHTSGTFVAPQAWEIPDVSWLTGEVFGPILHVVRYRTTDLDKLITAINAIGFGLTGGVHSRIASTVQHVEQRLRSGNFYVNRSLIGAVVGVQPFGGQANSGTGPKAGGPHYLARFATERVTSTNLTAAGGNASLIMAAGE